MLFYRCTPPIGVNAMVVYEQFVDKAGQERYMLESPSGPIATQFCTRLTSGHAIGGKPTFFPVNFGIPLGEKSAEEYYLLQVHYDNPEHVFGIKRSAIQTDIYYTDKLRENDGAFLSFAQHIPDSSSILLPPGEKDHSTFGYCSANCTKNMINKEGIQITGAILRSHLTGRMVKKRQFSK